MGPLWVGLLLVAMTMMVAPPARGIAPPSKAKAAAKLDKQAKKAYRAKKWHTAVELWREARKLEDNWKYAFNLAYVLFEAKQFPQAWEAIADADRLGVPPDSMSDLAALRANVSGALLKTHAWVKLEVVPAHAIVQRDAQLWAEPRAAWIAQGQSRIRVERKGFVPVDITWKHPVGARHNKTIRLKKEEPHGSLVVKGSPVGAEVMLSGARMGTLPQVVKVELKVGRYEVAVVMDGFEAETRTMSVVAGQQVTWEVALKATATTPLVVEKKPAGSDLRTPGWITAGVGLAAVAGGIGMFVWADGAANDLDALNQDPGRLGELGGYPAYETEYSEAESNYNAGRIGGWVLTGVGAAAVVAGVVMIALPAQKGEPETSSISVLPLRGGGLLNGTVRF